MRIIGQRSWQYGPNAAKSAQKRRRANIPQYGPEQVRLVSCLLYGIVSLSDRTLLRLVNGRTLRLPSASFKRKPFTCKTKFRLLQLYCCDEKLISAILKVEFPGREKNTETDRFLGNGSYCRIPTENQPIRVFHLA